MKTEALTEKSLEKLKVQPGKRDAFVFDEALPGFHIRRFASGRASYAVKYSVGTQQRRLTLGAAVPGILSDMRRRAADILARARLGEDVVAKKRAAAAKTEADRNRVTVGTAVAAYLKDRESELRPRSFGETRRYLLNAWEPLHEKYLDTVTRDDVISLLNKIEKQGKVTADRARAALSAFFVWSIDRGLVGSTPLANVRPRAKIVARDRVLSESELVEIWTACDDDGHGAIVKLLMLTGQRRTEIGDLRWSEVDFVARLIELPGQRTKNHRRHVVPLSDAALNILSRCERREERDFVFGRSAGGFSGWSKCKARLDARIAKLRKTAGNASDMAPWTLHDLRRSAVTHMAQHKLAQPHILEAVINHASGHKAGIASVYNLATYPEEKRAALDAWAKRLTAMTR